MPNNPLVVIPGDGSSSDPEVLIDLDRLPNGDVETGWQPGGAGPSGEDFSTWPEPPSHHHLHVSTPSHIMLRGDDHVGSQPKGEGSITPPDFSYTDLGNLIRKGKKIQEEEDAHIQAGPGTQGLKDDGAITKKGIEHPTGPQPPQEVKPDNKQAPNPAGGDAKTANSGAAGGDSKTGKSEDGSKSGQHKPAQVKATPGQDKAGQEGPSPHIPPNPDGKQKNPGPQSEVGHESPDRGQQKPNQDNQQDKPKNHDASSIPSAPNSPTGTGLPGGVPDDKKAKMEAPVAESAKKGPESGKSTTSENSGNDVAGAQGKGSDKPKEVTHNMEPEPEVVKKPSKQQDSVAPTIKVSPPGSSDDTPGGPSFGNELNAGAAKIETPPGNLKGLPEPSSSIINARSIAFTTGAVAAVVAIGTLLIWTRRVKRHGRYRASSPSIFTRLRSNFRRGRSLNSLDNGNRVELVYDYGDSVARKSKPSSPNISTKLQTPHYANTIPGQITLPPSRLVKIDDIYVEQPPGVSFVQEIDPSIDYNAATVVSERMSLGPHTDLLHYDTQLDDSYPQNPTIRALKNGNNDGSGGRISSFATNESVMFFEDPDLSHNPHTDNLVSKPPIVGKKVARPKTGKHDPTADARRKHTSASSSIYSDI